MRTLRTVLIVALLMGLSVPAGAAEEPGAQVLNYDSVACDMAWYPTGFDGNPEPVLWGDCKAHNVMTPNGDYLLVLTGTLPDESMERFASEGYPATYETGCLVNYVFMIEAGFPQDEFEFTTSVRRYSHSGQFTEVCMKKSDL